MTLAEKLRKLIDRDGAHDSNDEIRPIMLALLDCVDEVVKASGEKWEVESESTGIKYGGPTSLANSSASVLTRLSALCDGKDE